MGKYTHNKDRFKPIVFPEGKKISSFKDMVYFINRLFPNKDFNVLTKYTENKLKGQVPEEQIVEVQRTIKIDKL